MRAVCMPIIGGGTGEAQAGAVVACRDRPPPARRFGKGALAKEGELERGWACWEDDEKRMYCTDKQRPAAVGGVAWRAAQNSIAAAAPAGRSRSTAAGAGALGRGAAGQGAGGGSGARHSLR